MSTRLSAPGPRLTSAPTLPPPVEVTFVVPTYNSGRTIERCLASLVAQGAEVIVVDNDSQDDTRSKAAARGARVVVGGPERSAQRNLGLSLVRTDVVCFIDSDQTLDPGAADELRDRFGHDPSLAALVLPERSHGSGYLARCRDLEKRLIQADGRREFVRAFRTDVLRAAGGYRADLTAFEDAELHDRIARYGRIERARSHIWHDEGRVRPLQLFRKKMYYGRDLGTFARSAGTRGLLSRSPVLDLFRRATLTTDPAALPGLLFLKLVDLAGLACGAIAAFVARADASSGAREPPAASCTLRTVLTYAVPIVLVVAATFAWYETGTFVASGDVGPFYRDGLRTNAFRGWGYTATGAGSRVAESTRILEVAVATVASGLGLAPQVAQHALYALWLALTVSGVVFCLRQLQPGSHLAAAVASLVAVASPVMLTSLPSPLVFITLGTIAFGVGLLVRVARGERAPLWAVVLVSLPLAAVGSNPAYLAATVIGVATGALYVAAAEGRRGLRKVAGYCIRAVPVLVVVHAWWIVPAVQHFAGSNELLVAQTDVVGWSWTHANASIGRLLTTTAHWGWDEYYEWTARVERFPFAVLLWIFPLCALAAPVVVRPGRARRIALTCCAIGVGALFVAKGLHPPFAAVNLWIYDHVPGFWMFREPVSKFGPILLLALTIGFSLFLGRFLQIVGSVGARRVRVWSPVLLCGAVLLPGYPLYTGQVVPAGFVGRVPSARVHVPEAWRRIAERINADERPGKLLVLPAAGFYQMGTNWGFYGVADLPRQMVRRPTLMEFPGGYFSAIGTHAALLREAERRLQSGRTEGFARLLDALGVSHVLVRQDYTSQNASIDPVRPGPLVDALVGTELFERPERYGVATLFARRWVPTAVQRFDAVAHVSSSTSEGIARFVTRLPYGTAALTGGVRRGSGALDLRVDTPGVYSAALESEGGVPYDASVVGGRDARLTLRPAFRLVVDGDQQVAPPRVEAPIGDAHSLVGLEVDSDLVPLADRMRVSLSPHTSVRPLFVRGVRSSPREWSPVADCNDVDERDADLALSVGDEITLSAQRHSACTSSPIRGGASGIRSVSFEHRTVRGTGSRVCVWLVERRRCSPSMRLAPSRTWQRESMLVRIPPGEVGRIYLYADAAPGTPTVKQFRRVVTRSVERGKAVAAPLDAIGRQLELGRTSSVRERIDPVVPPLDAAQLGNCNNGSGDEGIAMNRLGSDGLRLRARRGSACAAVQLPYIARGRTYRLTLEHRTVRGAPARVCVWLVGVDRCAVHAVLSRRAGNGSTAIEFDALEASTGARVYLYADGARGAETVTEYRDLRVEQVVTYTISVPSGSTGPSKPDPEILSVEPDRIRFRTTSGGASIVLALADSADDGWRLRGLPAGAEATPVVVDGYRQGWRVDRAGSFEGTIEFTPAAAGRAARATSVLALALLFAGTITARRITPRRRRRHTRVARTTASYVLRVGRHLARRTKLHGPALGAAHRMAARLAIGPGDERGLCEVSWRGARIAVPAHDVTILPSLMDGEYESVECDVLEAVCRPGMTVVDAGANVGLHSTLLARAIGQTGRVHAFEPDASNVRLLEENLRANGCTNVVVHPHALGSRRRTAVLNVSTRDTGTHTLVDGRVRGGAQCLVDVHRLDEVLPDARIDILKLDVEGWEGQALLGAVELLERQVPLVLFEFDPQAPTRAELLTLVQEYWERCYAVHPRRRRLERVGPTDWAGLSFTNVFAVPRAEVEAFEAIAEGLDLATRGSRARSDLRVRAD